MNLLKKEIKISGYDTIVILVAIFILINCIIFINPKGKNIAIILFLEIIVPIVSAIKSAYILENKSDMEMILCGKVSIFIIVLVKYLAVVGMVLLVSLVEIFLFKIMYTEVNLNEMIIALVPTTFYISSFGIFLSILFKNNSIGSCMIGFLWLVQIGVGRKLADMGAVHVWYEFISFFNTLFLFCSSLWIPSKIILSTVSFLLWGLMFILLKSRERVML